MNPDILDEDGQPIPKQTGRVKRFWEWLIANWKVVLPIAVSVTALFVAVWSVCVAKRDSEVTRRLSKLDFRPVLRLYTVLNPTGKIVPFWQVTNTGPVEAVQVKVEMISHRYSPSRQKMFFRLKDSTNTTTIPTIAPEETKGYLIIRIMISSCAVSIGCGRSNRVARALVDSRLSRQPGTDGRSCRRRDCSRSGSSGRPTVARRH